MISISSNGNVEYLKNQESSTLYKATLKIKQFKTYFILLWHFAGFQFHNQKNKTYISM